MRRFVRDGHLDLEVGRLFDDNVLCRCGDRNGGIRTGGDIKCQVLGLLRDLEADRTGRVHLDGRDARLCLNGNERLGIRFDVDFGSVDPDNGRRDTERSTDGGDDAAFAWYGLAALQ